jgi:hypothetical protein
MIATNELDPNIDTPEAKAVAAEQQDAKDELLDYQTARIHLDRMVKDWNTERNVTHMNRAKRDVNIDVEALRQQGKLDDDETLIPVRVIDTNIQREQPAYINYLKNSRRICTFNSLTNPDENTQKLELEFTRGMTYIGWETPHYRCLDGAQTHGWDSVEVVLDETKPLGVALEQIGHDSLFFPTSSIDLQFSARVIRRYEMTLLQLDKFAANPAMRFSVEQIAKIKESRKSTAKELETIQVYKHYCKKEGSVYVSWFCLENGCDDWLQSPSVLDLGLVNPQTLEPVATTFYPIFIDLYRESEKPHIMAHKGRAWYDDNKQEAQTAILSGYVNKLTRSANIYASPAKEDGTGGTIKEIEGLQMVGGRILSQPINFWSTEPPDPQTLNALQYFDVANSQETNQPNFAVNNRQDSRKTATEIGAADKQQQLLNSVQLTMFSTFIREVYNCCWLVVQSLALKDKIVFLQIPQQQPMLNPLDNTPMIDPATGQPMTQQKMVNDKATIGQIYDVRAAGDVDVIQRQEQIQQMMQDWPVVQNTPLRDQFLQDLMRLKYPTKGESYANLIAQQPQLDALKGIVARLGTIMQGVTAQHPEVMQGLQASQQADVQQLIQQSLQVAASLGPQQQPGQTGPQ